VPLQNKYVSSFGLCFYEMLILSQAVPEPSEFEKKKQTFITRLIWTVVMVSGFIAALLSGHIYIIILISAIQIISFREVISIIDVPSKARSLRFTKSLNWYFLGTAMYFLYGESVIYYFKHIVLVDKIFLPFATHHRFICFMLYIFGKLAEKHKFVHDAYIGRVCFLCWISSKRTLPISISTVCLDTHCIVSDCSPSSLCHEQYIRRNDLVLITRCSSHCQRYHGICLWYNIWSNSINQTVSKEDGGRIFRCLDIYSHIRLHICQLVGQVHLLHLSSQCKFRSYC
jgi:Cytidylyltransferase family